jgi:hypothetical protein
MWQSINPRLIHSYGKKVRARLIDHAIEGCASFHASERPLSVATGDQDEDMGPTFPVCTIEVLNEILPPNLVLKLLVEENPKALAVAISWIARA